jgi:hypothetical protein
MLFPQEECFRGIQCSEYAAFVAVMFVDKRENVTEGVLLSEAAESYHIVSPDEQSTVGSR